MTEIKNLFPLIRIMTMEKSDALRGSERDKKDLIIKELCNQKMNSK